MPSLYLTRKHLQTLGLSPYQSRLVTLDCEICGKQGNANLYALPNIFLSTKSYLQKKRIRQTTKVILEELLQAINILQGNVLAVPFNNNRHPHQASVIYLINNKSETAKFRLRAMELQRKMQNV